VDAASEFLTTPESWLARGADLVVYSVSKFMRGPPATGLLLGKERLVRAAWLNGAPHQAFGRAMKLGKEQMVGALVALEEWLKRDAVADQTEWASRLALISDILGGVEGVRIEWIVSQGRVPKLRVGWAKSPQAPSSDQLRVELLARRPRILIDDIGACDDAVLIDPFSLTDEEARLVGTALAETLTAKRCEIVRPGGSAALVTGDWAVEIGFAARSGTHEFRLWQDGGQIAGEHKLSLATAKAEGRVSGSALILKTTHRLEGNIVQFRFTGHVEGDRMGGLVTMGSAGDHTQGPVAFGQFGTASWSAKRS
jgi:hypothetical protein